MAMGARHRYIALNAGVWLLLAAAGGAGILLLRQYGAAIAERERARTVIARAEDHFQDGDLATCQAEITQALTLSPDLLGELLDRFGARLLGLPNVLEYLATSATPLRDPATPNALAAAQLDLIRGDTARASQLLDQYVSVGGRDPRAVLWKARIALDAARFAEARSEFDRYWQANPAAKKELIAEIKGRAPGAGPEPQMQTGRAFFWAGLWDESFAAFTEAAKTGGAGPDLEFFQGVAADLAGKDDEARAHYVKTLDQLPNHLLCLRRMQALGLPPAAR